MTAEARPNVWSRMLDFVFGAPPSPEERERLARARPPQWVDRAVSAGFLLSLGALVFAMARQMDWISYPSKFLDSWGMFLAIGLGVVVNLTNQAVNAHYMRKYDRKAGSTAP